MNNLYIQFLLRQNIIQHQNSSYSLNSKMFCRFVLPRKYKDKDSYEKYLRNKYEMTIQKYMKMFLKYRKVHQFLTLFCNQLKFNKQTYLTIKKLQRYKYQRRQDIRYKQLLLQLIICLNFQINSAFKLEIINNLYNRFLYMKQQYWINQQQREIIQQYFKEYKVQQLPQSKLQKTQENTVSSFYQNSCFNCIQFLQKNSVFNIPNQYKNLVLTMPGLQRLQPGHQFQIQDRCQLQKMVCSIMNQRKGYIFIGINRIIDNQVGVPKYQVIGVESVKNSIFLFQQKLYHLLTHYINPSYFQNRNFKNVQISYIPVVNFNNFDQKFQQKQKQFQPKFNNQNYQNRVVIRIKIQLQLHQVKYGRMFYVTTLNLAQDKNILDEFYQIQDGQPRLNLGYSQMLSYYRKYIKKIKNMTNHNDKNLQLYGHQYQIKCYKPIQFKYNNTLINQINQKQQQQSPKIKKKQKFGRFPFTKYPHQSLIIVPQKNKQIFQKFILDLDNKRVLNQCYQIFEKLQTKSKRKVFYLAHQIKYQKMNKILEDIQPTQKQSLLLLDVRNQFVLKSIPSNIEQIFRKLYYKFNQIFHDEILYGLKIEYKSKHSNQQNSQYFFQFRSLAQAMFAFIFFQYQNIRCNFVNNKKLNNIELNQLYFNN